MNRHDAFGGRQRGGLPLSVLLFAALVLPLGIVIWVTGSNLSGAQEHRRTATALIRRTEMLGALGGLYLPGSIEVASLRGLAIVDALGVDRQVAAQYSGLDFDAYIAANRDRFEAALTRLEDVAGGQRIGDPPTLVSDRVAGLRAHLASVRQRSSARLATDAEVQDLRGEVDSLDSALLDSARVGLRAAQRSSAALVALSSSAERAVDVVTSSSSQLLGLFDWTFDRPSPPAFDVQRRAAHQDALVNEFIDDAVGSEAAAMSAVRASPERSAWQSAIEVQLPLLTATSSRIAEVDPQRVKATTELVSAHIAYYARVDDAIGQALQSLLDQAKAEGRSATRGVQRSILALVVAVLSALGATFVIRRQVVGPLGRLARSAGDVSRGVMPEQRLSVTGPTEARAATQAFNELISSLRVVNTAVDELANGQVADTQTAGAVGGPIGQALRQSMSNLSALTARLQHSEALATAIVSTAADSIWTVDEDGRVLSANRAAEQLLGVPAQRQLGWRIAEFLDGREGEAVAITADGEPVPVLVSSSEVDVGDAIVSTVFARNIAERRRLELQLAFQARHDSLTLLPNRSAALERIEQLLEAGSGAAHSAVAVLFIDLDGFKAVNDTHGHSVGDRVLRVAASRLRQVIRQGDFAARLGGDEFVVISAQPNSVAEMVTLGERLIREFERPIVWQETSFTISASVGVAVSEPGDSGAPELIRRADDATYLAKSRGRGRVEEYNASLQAKIEEQSSTELALRQGVRRGDLRLFVQPIVDLRTGRFVGAESLSRWPRRSGRLSAAHEFIAVAERSSLINEVDRWTLYEGCRLLRHWSDIEELAQLSLSVNLSGRHLMDERVLDDIDSAIHEFAVNPHRLHLELTETHILTDIDRARETLAAIDQRGVSIAVDDFGAGYASMTYLREFPAKIVKLDRRFVARAQSDRYDEAIVTAMIGLGSALDMLIIAEGIETQEQLDFVRRVGCDQAQGYFLCDPLPVEQIDTWLIARDLQAWVPDQAEAEPTSIVG